MRIRVRLVVQDLVRQNGLWIPGRETAMGENSWLKAIVQLHEGVLRGANMTIKDTGGVNQTFDYDRLLVMQAVAPAASDVRGIWVGTGTTLVDRDDYTLAAKVAHGTGAGQLYYQACTVTGPTAISGGYREEIARQFDNSSGDTITVQEVGLVVGFTDTGGTSRYALILRDLTGSVAIPNATSKLFKYRVDFLA